MQNYIKTLQLKPHEEGGHFAVFYKSSDKVTIFNKRNEEVKYVERYASSSIYFLLEKQEFSAWHRLKSDEIWHYYDGGSPIDIYVIDHAGELKNFTLGNPGITKNASFQVIIKAGVWFAAEVRDKSSFGLAGCTMSPAFEYDDFKLANRKHLSAKYPMHKNIINKFTRVACSDLA